MGAEVLCTQLPGCNTHLPHYGMRIATLILFIATVVSGFARRWVLFFWLLAFTIIVGFFALVYRF